jgi:hypothetical protein
MPAKETRESIEAELNGGERERLLQKLRELVQNWAEFERVLQEREAKAGLPTYDQSKPIVERMAAVGMSQDAIDHFKTWMDSIVKINAQADAELSGAELLEGIAQNHRKA